MMRFFADPLTYVSLFGLCGAGLIVAGVSVLFGTGPALLVSGGFLIAAAAFISRGMRSNG